MSSESILEQIIQNKQSQVLNDFNPKIILNTLFINLSDREKEVVNLRHGLTLSEKKTLEEIGKKFQITRERVRQIENTALKKIKNHPEVEDKIKDIEQMVKQTIMEYGGIMRHDYLLEKILVVAGDSAENFNATSFIISQLLSPKLQYIKENENIYSGWKLPTASLDEILKSVNILANLINNHGEPLTIDKILDKLGAVGTAISDNLNFDENNINSYLIISKNIEKNPFNEWGDVSWRTINLKRMSDKVYLVLSKQGEPMHFTDIAAKINEIGFDKKRANAATIHNELILDEKYVLVGRGIYALKEWGYQPGIVADVIKQIIKESGPLTKEEIIEKVLKKRQVKRSTIILALMNKNNFAKSPNKTYNTVNS